MKSFDAAIRNYWEYYLELESEFFETKRYVQFDERNNTTFSVEFLKLFQAVCSEIDVVGKHIASIIDPNFNTKKCKNIYQWWIEIQDTLFINTNVRDFFIDNKNKKQLKDISIMNYVVDKEYCPWANFAVERYIDAKGSNRIRTIQGTKIPSWWSEYNDVKHHRAETTKEGVYNFLKANLHNVLNSIAALYLLELAVLELSANDSDDCEHFKNESKLFKKDGLASRNDIDKMFSLNKQEK